MKWKERGAEWADGRSEREWDGEALEFGGYFDAGLPVAKSAPNPYPTLDTLEELYLGDNNLGGLLPAHMGSASCLPSLKRLNVQGNKQLGGVIDAHFLYNSEVCNTKDRPVLELPFLSGVSLSSFNIQEIFRQAPKAVVDEGRAQGKATDLYPKLVTPRDVRRTQTWLSELRQLRKWYLFVFVTPEKGNTERAINEEGKKLGVHEGGINRLSFETKFKSKMYTEGKIDDRDWSSTRGSFMSGRAWCKEQCFDPSRGFADEDLGFEVGEEASGVLDWERRHLVSASKKHWLQAVFVSSVFFDGHTKPTMVQVTRPSWCEYDGLEAPIGTFAYTPGWKRVASMWAGWCQPRRPVRRGSTGTGCVGGCNSASSRAGER
jgi:hypothetical protein